MSRPVKARTICSEPKVSLFRPCNFAGDNYVYMSLDEYETIRLIDYNCLTQEECASFMNVARTTVQKIYDDARKKVSDALVNGKGLKIEGGNYNLCTKMLVGRHCNKKKYCRRFDIE